MWNRKQTLGLFAIAFLLAVCNLRGQTERARVYGTVKDATDAVIGGGAVVITNAATGVKTRAVSNFAGAFVLSFLNPGTYDLEVRKEGFRPYRETGIVLDVAAVLRVDVVLEVGAVTSSVEVKAQAAVLETGSGTVDQVMPNRLLTEVPLAERQTLDLVRSAGAVVYMGLNNNNKAQFSLAGGRVLNQSFWLDGGNIQNTRIGIGQNEYDSPVEFLQELRVMASTYTAEFGSSASGVIVTTTKSGGNRFHGSAWEFFRNDKLDAAGPTAPLNASGNKIKAPLRYNLFGGTLGGPVIRNRTHFYVGYQRTQTTNGSTQILTVPAAVQRRGDFSETTNAGGNRILIYDPFSNRTVGTATVRDAFPGNVIPANRLDPVSMALADSWPLPNKAAVNRAGAQNFAGNSARYSPWDDVLARVDHAFSDSNRFYFRYLYGTRGFHLSTVYPDAAADPAAIYTARRPQTYLLFSDTHTFTPNLLGDLRFSMSDRTNEVMGAGTGSGVAQRVGIKGVPGDSFPNLSIAGMQSVGNSRRTFNYPNRQYQIVGSITAVRGNHIVKMGGETRRAGLTNLVTSADSGAYNFATTGSGLPGNGQTGFGFASFLLGWGQSFSYTQGVPLRRSGNYMGAFIQDDWKVTRNLTLNIGVRWETDTALRDRDNQFNGFDAGAANPVSGTPGVVRFAGIDGWRVLPYDTDWNNIGPRFGFAWKPFGSAKWVVRGGYGISYEHPFDDDVTSAASLGFVQSANITSPDNGITPAFVLKNGVTIPSARQALDASFGAVRVGASANTAVTFFETNRQTGYAQQFNLGVQRQLGEGMLLEISYMGMLARHMPGTTLTYNQVPPDKMAAGNAQSRRPYPQFSNVSALLPSLGVTNYHAGMVRLERRAASGLTVLASYTWSRNIGNLAEAAGSGDNQNYQDFYNRKADKGPSTIDVPHRVTTSAVYDLPLGKQRRWLRTHWLTPVLGGWTLSAVTSAQSGGPFTVTMQTNTSNAFAAGALRANLLRDGSLAEGSRTLTRWFDPDAFQAPAAYTFGNAGRGILRGPGRVSFDGSIQKNLMWLERLTAQIRVDLLNAFNHSNLGTPGHSMGSPSFGVTTPEGSRVVQLGVRLLF